MSEREQKDREPAAGVPGPAEETEAAEAKEEAAEKEAAERAAPEAGSEADGGTEEKPGRKPTARRSADAVAARRAAPRRPVDGALVVRAQAKYVRCAPRKARLVVDHIRGKSVEEARAILRHTTRAASRDVLKVLESAVANAESNHELTADELTVAQAYVDEGPTIKRYRPRALGRATRIRKRTSHMTITLVPKEETP
jgi:large subunit ribosomal protein L22